MAVTTTSPIDLRPKADKAIVDRHEILLKALGRPDILPSGGSTSEIAPIATYSKDKRFFIEVEVPGIDKANLSKEIQVEAAPRLIVIRIDKKAPSAPVLWGELRFGMRERQVAIPANADHTNAAATYEDGVLTVTVPLSPLPPGRTSVTVG